MARGRQKYIRDVKKTCMTITTENFDKLTDLSEKNKMSRSDFVNALIENCSENIRICRQMTVMQENTEV